MPNPPFLSAVVAQLGEMWTITLAGLLIGVLFGFFAQKSRFCLRSAVIEFSRKTTGGKLSVWLLTFSSAVIAIQGLIVLGWLDVGTARQLANRGSLSGALIGGLLFGAGMVMTRGCASRLLVLSANGNLRALLSGLIFAVVATASLKGILSPLRLWLAELWTVEGGASRDLIAITGIGHTGALAFAGIWLVAAVYWARRQKVPFWGWFGGMGVGAMVALAWLATYAISHEAFDMVIGVQSLSFTGPASDVLLLVLSPPGQPLKFDIGLVPGVFIGSFVAAALARELKLEGFQGGPAMRRYIAGAVLMGFGGMLAGGCAVGAGVSGAAVFTLTAWVTLFAMWGAAMFTDWWMDGRHEVVTTPQGPSEPVVPPARVPA